MEVSEFRTAAAQMIDFITDYQENIRSRPVSPNVRPGYLRHLVPDHAPEKAETWDQVRQPPRGIFKIIIGTQATRMT